MTTQDATLIAAVIAAAAAVLKLFVDRFTEDRTSARILLQPLLAEMGEANYGVVATCSTLLKAATPEAFENWHAKARAERDKLRVLRPKLRYPLWGLDEGLRVLQRLPDWCGHARVDAARASRLINSATSLRHALDVSAMRCFRGGRLPSLLERARVNFHAWRCREAFKEGAPTTFAENDS